MEQAVAALMTSQEAVAIVASFEATVRQAVASAYLSLDALGLPDEQIVSLLGLPSEGQHQAGTPGVEAA